MKKRMIMLGLLTIVSFVLGAAPVMADTPVAASNAVKFSDEQVKLAQLNWNAYMEVAKNNPSAVAYMTPITSVYPDSVIGKAAIVHHFSPHNPYYAYAPQAIQNTPAVTNNPYFEYYPYYYCTYQY